MESEKSSFDAESINAWWTEDGICVEMPEDMFAELESILWKVESGNPAVAMGIYAAVLHALGNMDSDLLIVAKDDQFGRQLQDMNLLTRKRASRSRTRTAKENGGKS